MTYPFYYSPSADQAFSANQLIYNFGIANLATISLDALNIQGFYPVISVAPSPDPQLYVLTPVYTIVGQYAEQGWSTTPLPLSTAKITGSAEAKAAANAALDQSVCNCGYSTDLLTAVASQDPLDRPARFQAELDEMTAITNQLDADLAAIDAATSVDEIDSILKGPYGTFVSSRSGLGPEDMTPSYFTVLENLPPGIGEPELEIYIPGTDTVIPYDAELPEPYKFDSAGNCYNVGDYRTVIRVAATGQVLSTVYPPSGAAVPIEWTYNPTIPSLGGGGSSSSSAK